LVSIYSLGYPLTDFKPVTDEATHHPQGQKPRAAEIESKLILLVSNAFFAIDCERLFPLSICLFTN